MLEQAIRRFEPRIGGVRVTMLDRDGADDRTLRFRIEAEMPGDPSPHLVAFESFLDSSTSTFHVQRSAR